VKHDPADDQVAEDLQGFGDLLSQDGLPGRETLPDRQLQVANLRPADAGLRPRSRDRPPRDRV